MASLLKHIVANSGSTQLLEILKSFLDTAEDSRDAEFYSALKSVLLILQERDGLSVEIVDRVARELCLPVFHSKQVLSSSQRLKNFVIYDILVLCCAAGPKELLKEVCVLCLEGLSFYTGETHHTAVDGIPVDVCLDLIAYLAKHRLRVGGGPLLDQELEGQFYDCLLNALQHTNELMCAKITGVVLPEFLSCEDKVRQERIQTLWSLVKDISTLQANGINESTTFYPSYSILCGLANFFFDASTATNNWQSSIVSDPEFWILIQQGLKLQEPLSRKRSIYLLKIALDYIEKSERLVKVVASNGEVLFFWSPQEKTSLLDTWQEFVLMIETLDESQAHVVKPVLPRLSKIIAATHRNQKGTPSLAVSWLTTILIRASLHDNKSIRKWAILEVLTIDQEKCPLLDRTNWPFLLGPFQKMLDEYMLYGREDSDPKGEPPAIGSALKVFYQQCLQHLPTEDHGEFLTSLITAIDEYHFKPIPLVFVSQALANIPPCQAWGWESLQRVRSILVRLVTHAPRICIAIECFLLKAVTRLYQPTQVTWENIHYLLSSIRLDEFLIRGSCLWREFSQWLWSIESCTGSSTDSSGNHIGTTNLGDFLAFTTKKYLNKPTSDVSSEDDLNGLIYMVVAASDACHASWPDKSSTSPLQVVQELIVNTITHANTHVYMPEAKGYRAVRLLSAILRVLNVTETTSTVPAKDEDTELQDSGDAYNVPKVTCELVCSALRTSLSDILSLLARKIENGSGFGKKAYLKLCLELHLFIRNNSSLKSMLPEFYKFVEVTASRSLDSIKGLQDSEEHSMAELKTLQQAMLFISWACEVASTSPETVHSSLRNFLICAVPTLRLDVQFTKPSGPASSFPEDTSYAEDLRSFEWSNMISDFIEAQWSAVGFYLQQSSNSMGTVTEDQVSITLTSPQSSVVDSLWDALDIVYVNNYPPVLKCLGLLLPKLIDEDVELCSKALDETCRTLQDARETETFWPILDECVTVLFSPDLLKLPADHPLTAKVEEFWKELLAHGENRVGIMVKIIHQLCNAWHGFDDVTRRGSLRVHLDIIFDACLFGPAMEKAKQVDNDVAAYLRNLGNETSLCTLKAEDWRDDTQVRVAMVNTLLSLDPNQPQDLELLKDVVLLFLEYDKQTLKSKPRCYLSSPYHRRKHRVWQVILILASVVMKDGKELEFAKNILHATLASMLCENQVSIRNFHEWTILQVLSRHPELQSILWEEMTYDPKKRVGRSTSLISIATLLVLFHGKDQPEGRGDLIRRAITAIFPWVMTNHRSVRSYAHVAIHRIWTYCTAEGLDGVIMDSSFLKPCIEFMVQNHDNPAEKKRILENYFFFDIHPFEDLSIEAVYHIIPRLSGMTDEELISPNVFEESAVGERVWNGSMRRHGIPLYIPNRSKAHLVLNTYNWREDVNEQVRLRISGERQTKIKKVKTSEKLEDESIQSHGDVQKKIIAWKIVPPDEQLLSELQEQRMVSMQRSAGGDLIVVASLIDKAPNLGGLCRTCEIFGVRKLVLGSENVMNDPFFKGLSVTSAKWVDIEQVRPADIKPYLIAMRKEGYTLIGVEQTANSHCLTEYRFPHNALLLLGNEKEGIPVDLIQLLDACVEIPQVGIIRSLNVHVSGALLIWEYTRQRILTSGTPATGK